ncbi:GlsB/YeaQ/YmgE family stress response membrane protein [Herbaspirillum chlorophenolicum]|uniref:GlsB/YeaQ/YmgE family stress response membrane protein n=1 Tax=Herbaspirillum chlorophenolicum TaxID=211589 RepID=UPI001E4268C2|nr:GlsB/YeaQ/YmgE family stress response membrane protein [Herbaspirillum chlorophenolicum]
MKSGLEEKEGLIQTLDYPIDFSMREITMMHYIWMLIVGIVVGAIARLIVPGSEHMGIFLTGILGIAGSFVGGFISRLFSRPEDGAIVHPAGILLSIVGAILVLLAYNHFVR